MTKATKFEQLDLKWVSPRGNSVKKTDFGTLLLLGKVFVSPLSIREIFGR